jgi:hypothetical protein
MPLQTSPWKALACARARVRAGTVIALALACLAVVLFAPRAAFAQTVTQTMGTSILDFTPSGGPSLHPNNVDATWISYTDCETDVQIYVPLTVTVPPMGFAYYGISAYATTISGTDCGISTNRSGATGVCWQVALSPGVLTAIPVQQATYQIRVRDLLRDIGQAAGVGLTYPNGGGTEAACHVAAQSGAIPLSLQFVIADHGGNEDSNVQIGLNVELIGPAPPTGITLGVGEGLLKLSWTPVSDPNTQGFNIFIDPLPGKEGLSVDAAAPVSDAKPPTIDVCVDEGVIDGGVDEAGDAISIPVVGMCHQVTVYEAGSIQTTACPSNILTSGVTGVIDSGTAVPVTTTLDASATTAGTNDAGFTTVVSGTAPTLVQLGQIDPNAQVGGGTQTSATITGLKDGYVYTVAIAAIDNLNDNGPLSVPQCATPSPIDDFYSQYRADGGLAGGSFCALEGVGIPAGTGVFGLIMVGACVALLRRRREQ